VKGDFGVSAVFELYYVCACGTAFTVKSKLVIEILLDVIAGRGMYIDMSQFDTLIKARDFEIVVVNGAVYCIFAALDGIVDVTEPISLHVGSANLSHKCGMVTRRVASLQQVTIN
jgi:hypothetical protein